MHIDKNRCTAHVFGANCRKLAGIDWPLLYLQQFLVQLQC